MIARDTQFVNHKIIFQAAPNAYERFDQGIDPETFDDKESIRREVFNLFTHTSIIMQIRVHLT